MSRVAVRSTDDDDQGDALFAAIGRLLADHRLSHDPAHYAFAHRVVSDPDGHLATTVAHLTEGGVRLTTADIAALSGEPADDAADADDGRLLADRTEHQLRDFVGLLTRLRAETSGFGRDLAAAIGALEAVDSSRIVRLTATMIDRVQRAEARLQESKREAEALREALEAARGDARSDVLTGLPNRRALIEDFTACAARGAPLYLAVCDIDHFKRINDRFGHPIGDRVLQAIAGALAETCGGAFVTRYGGEEFAVLFSGGDLADAADTLDRARAVVAAKRYKVRGDDTPIGSLTFSAGLIAVAPDEAFDFAFDRADALLYAAKNDGRNQIRY